MKYDEIKTKKDSILAVMYIFGIEIAWLELGQNQLGLWYCFVTNSTSGFAKILAKVAKPNHETCKHALMCMNIDLVSSETHIMHHNATDQDMIYTEYTTQDSFPLVFDDYGVSLAIVYNNSFSRWISSM